MDGLRGLDATALAGLVRRGEASPRELVESAIEEIERSNTRLNAVVSTRFDQALREASSARREGPFAGVPFLLKDLATECAGLPLTCASRFLSGRPDGAEDSEFVRRLRRAGLIILGRTNSSEFGILPTTESRLFGPARNPWDPARTPGGSSGGAAAAVAAGWVPMAHANDGGASIPLPASCCGVFGLKPTRARTPWGPRFGDFVSGLAVEHALTFSVRDSAALLDAVAGPAPGDPYCAPAPARPFREEAGADPGRLRIAVSLEAPTGSLVHPDCVKAALEAARLCRELGHEVREARLPLDPRWASDFEVIRQAECAWQIEDWTRRLGRAPRDEDLEPATWEMLRRGRARSAAEYLLAWQGVQRLAREVAAASAGIDVWLSPVASDPPLPLGSFAPTPADPHRALAVDFASFPPIWSLTGQPSMSVPLFWNGQGLPIGTLFAARFGDEASLIRLAAQLEEARPWARWRPSLDLRAPAGISP